MAEAPAAAPTGERRFPCPSCGSELRFDPAGQDLLCPHCGRREPIDVRAAAIPELDLRAVSEKTLPASATEEIRVTRCGGCGAEIEFDAALHARECPFCAAPLVADTGVSRHIKPQAQLPFLVSESEAHAAMAKWLGRLWFAPSDLAAYARAERRMTGVYAPYWTYDADTETDYQGRRGVIRHETRHVSVMVNGRRAIQPQRVARVDWRPARGRVRRRFDDVLVLASKGLPKRYADAVAPWDLSALAPFDPRFLAGFRAEAYTRGVEDGYAEAKAIMNDTILADVRRDIGGDQQQVTALDTRVGALTFKHVLLPVWLAAFRYRGRSFRFVVNGRTGAVEGERPFSTVKVVLAILFGLVLAAAFAALQVHLNS